MRTNFRMNVVFPCLLVLLPAAALPDPAAGASASVDKADGAPSIELTVPLFDERFADMPAVQVGDDVITIRDLADALATTHSGHEGAAKKRDLGPLVDRLVDTRVIVLEARTMGLDEMKEVKKAIATFRTKSLREKLKERATANVKPDPQLVEDLYRQAAQEWKVRWVLFEKEEDAAAFAARAKDAAAFKEGATSAVAAGKAKGKDEPITFSRGKALAEVIGAVERMKVGDVSAPVKISAGYVLLLLEETRVAEIPEARAEATRTALAPKVEEALHDYFKLLTKKHAVVDGKLLAALDYDVGKRGIAALVKDKRALVRIRGEAPVTVADFTAELNTQIFHGVEQAASEKKVNRKKQQYFDSFLFRRLLEKEAKERRVADEPEFRRAAADFERSVLFTAFVERVVVPDVKVKDEEARVYYDGHQAEFRYPDFFKLETIAFRQARDAQAACQKIKAGTDVKWLRANADGQLDPEKRSLQVDGTTVTAASIPEGLAAVLSGASVGDCRMYAESDFACYTVLVVDKIPSRVQPFDEAKPEVEKRAFQQSLARSIEDWTKKLRTAHEVKVFVKGIGG